MEHSEDVYQIISSALSALDHRDPPHMGIFENALAMMRNIGYDDMAVYIIDEFPEAMRLVAQNGDEEIFSEFIPVEDGETAEQAVRADLAHETDIWTFPLFNQGKCVGALVVKSAKRADEDKTLSAVVKIFAVLAYIDTVRTNCQRERTEREIYFAQALANRLMMREAPAAKHYRLGFERWRTLEVGGDFFDFIPVKDGRVFAFIGKCSGTGMKTALETVEIMHHVDRCFVGMNDLPEIISQVNRHLVQIKNRAHLASLCIMEFDPYEEKVRLVRAGNFGLAIAHQGHLHNISREGEVFLGMVANLEMREEEYEFKPGSALICATEGIFGITNRHEQTMPAAEFDQTIEEARRAESSRALVNVALDKIRAAGGYNHAQNSIAAISVEFLKAPP